MNKRYPFPEIVSGDSGWKIFEDIDRPRTSNMSKEMYVPVGDKCIECNSYHDKQTRRHELGHVKWSPKTIGKLGPDESEVAVEVMEEVRINYLLAQRGMGIEDWVMCKNKVELLHRNAILTLSEFELICMLLSCMWKTTSLKDNTDDYAWPDDTPDNEETKLFHEIYNEMKPLLTEVRRVQINWVIEISGQFYKKLIRKGRAWTKGKYGTSISYLPSYRKTRNVAKELNALRDDFSSRPKPEEVLEEERQKKLAERNKANSFANMSDSKESKCSNISRESDEECSDDFPCLDCRKNKNDTLEAAEQRTKQSLFDKLGKNMGKINYDTENSYRGQWGAMDIIEAPLEINLQGKIKQGRKYRPQDYGTNPKYMNRWCVDKKVFKQQQRVYGGTILIDVSGSMSLHGEDILEIMQQLPAVTIGMYNYRGWRRDRDGIPAGTLRIVGKNGKRVTEEYLEEHTGGGNLVDGPALRWLAKMPAKRIWVSDMYVFGRHGGNQKNLLQECYQIMKQNGITRLADVEEVKRFALELNRLQ